MMKRLSRVRSLVAVSLILLVLMVPATWAAGDADLLQQGDDGGASPGAADELVSVSGIVDVMVNQESDDAEERLDTGKVYTKGDDLELGTDEGPSGTLSMRVGIRFQGIGIPQGATINSAYIEFTASEAQDRATNLTILGEASDNAQTYQGDDNEISTRTPAAASVAWNGVPAWSIPGAKHKTPDLKAIVQQIVNRPGWNTSNAMAFMFAGSGRRTAWSYDGAVDQGNLTLAPRLVIDYAGLTACQTLNRLSNPAGTGQITTDPEPNCGANTFYQGTPVEITAVPTGNNYSFGSWSGGATGSANPTTVVMNTDKTVTANFALGVCHTLTTNIVPVEADPVGLIRPTPSPNCGDGSKAGKYKTGTALMVDAVARGGWKFSAWSGALTGGGKPQPLTMDADKTVTATFVATCRSIKMKIDPTEAGTVLYTPPPNCEGSEWQPDQQVQLRAQPAAGWFFVKWTGDVTGGETFANPITVVMDGNKSIEAIFRFKSYQLWLPALFRRKS